MSGFNIKSKEGGTSYSRVYYDMDTQITGPSINYGLEFEITKNNNLGFSHSFSYGHIYYDTGTILSDFDDSQTINKSVNGLKQDYHFYYKRDFEIKDNKSLNLTIGYSLMNRGTNYSYSKVSHISEDDYTKFYLSGGFGFGALKVEVDYSVDRFTFGVGKIILDTNHSFDVEGYQMPFIKCSYKIF